MGDINSRVLARRQKDINGFVDQYEALLQQRALKFGDKIAPIWQRTAQRLEQELRKLLLRCANPDGTLSEDKLRTIGYKIAHRDKLRETIFKGLGLNKTAAQISEKMSNGIAYEYVRAYHFTAFGLEQTARVEVSVPTLSAAQVMGVVHNPWLSDGRNYSDRLRQNIQFVADKMYNTIGKGSVEGWNWNQTALEIRRVANEGYFNSVRLARTEYTRAAALGASHLYIENSDILDGKRWNATLDKKTSRKDARNDGKTYPLEYDTPEMPGNPGERIPNHPHCRCRWTPILSALGISTKERIARGEGDSPTNFGKRTYTKARTYEEYAKERGLPSLAERLADDNPSKYLRRGESLSDYGPSVGKEYNNPKPEPAAKAKPAPTKPATTYTPVNDVKKATIWAKDNLPIEHVDYKGFAPQLADDINATFLQLYDRYPEMKNRTKWVTTAQERNRQYTKRVTDELVQQYLDSHKGRPLPFTLDYYRKEIEKRVKPKPIPANNVAQSTGKRWGPQEGITFNEKWAKDYEKLAASSVRSVKIGWHPVGTENPVSNFTHEFGHQIDNLLTEKGLRGEINALWDKWKADILASGKGTQAYRETLSEYASKSPQEFVAEAFSEYIHNPNPRPVAKAVGEAIERAFEKLRKGVNP